MFLEEVVLPENEEHYKEVADSVAVPLATGERLYTRWQFKISSTRRHRYYPTRRSPLRRKF